MASHEHHAVSPTTPLLVQQLVGPTAIESTKGRTTCPLWWKLIGGFPSQGQKCEKRFHTMTSFNYDMNVQNVWFQRIVLVVGLLSSFPFTAMKLLEREWSLGNTEIRYPTDTPGHIQFKKHVLYTYMLAKIKVLLIDILCCISKIWWWFDNPWRHRARRLWPK